MNARIKAMGIVAALYSTVSGLAFTMVIQLQTDISEDLKDRKGLMEMDRAILNKYYFSSDGSSDAEIAREINVIGDRMLPTVEYLYLLFEIIQILSLLNFMFFIQHLITFIFVNKMGRYFDFPTFTQLADALLFGSSVILFFWVSANIKEGVDTARAESDELGNAKMMMNYQDAYGFPV
mmetsp:Transcript_13351/g.20857  ORF Transcript_13351/g.20857 Transcript_13351/m.20857 type:complete len:179 (-) Transcript_13351:2189-2725(-)